jgi:hypothetical protein
MADLVVPKAGRARTLAVAASFLLLAAMAAALPFVPLARFVALTLVIVAGMVVMGVVRFRYGQLDFLEVFFPVSALYLLYFGVGAIYLRYNPQILPSAHLVPYLEPALALSVLGYVAFVIGYGLPSRRGERPRPVRLRMRSTAAIMIPAAIGFAGSLATAFQFKLMRSGSGFSGVLSLAQQAMPLFLFAWALAWIIALRTPAEGRRILWPILAFLPAIGTAIALTVGGKENTITLIGIPALAFWRVRRKVPWKSLLVILLLSVFVVFPIYNTYRFVGRELGPLEGLDRTVRAVRKWDYATYADSSVGALIARLSVVSSVAAILRYTGRWVDYKYGETILLTPISLLIPRVLWPSKPNIGIAREFGVTFDLVSGVDRETQIAPTIVGELYWNFNLPGVLVGMFLLGAAYRWMYRRYGEVTANDPIRVATYIVLLTTAMHIEGNVAVLLGVAIKTIVLIAALEFFLRRIGAVVPVSDAGPESSATSG